VWVWRWRQVRCVAHHGVVWCVCVWCCVVVSISLIVHVTFLLILLVLVPFHRPSLSSSVGTGLCSTRLTQGGQLSSHINQHDTAQQERTGWRGRAANPHPPSHSTELFLSVLCRST
jgi:hypothetical protein